MNNTECKHCGRYIEQPFRNGMWFHCHNMSRFCTGHRDNDMTKAEPKCDQD